MALVNPAPGGTIGRTDEGVDWSSIRGNIGAVARGVITNVYVGLRGFGTTVIERLRSGQYVYYGLESGGGTPDVHTGEQVTAGQPIAPGRGTGGIEVGWWNPATGSAIGAPGYREGSSTNAGRNFRAAIGARRVQNVPSYVPPQYVPWVQRAAAATGMPAAVVAAQIEEESGFNASATSPTGAEGIAQIEPGTWKSLGIRGSPYAPGRALLGYVKDMRQLLNQYHGDIRKALAAYNAGSGNLQAGYGYADAILSRAGMSGSAQASAPGRTRPGGNPSGDDTTAVQNVFAAYQQELTTPRTAPSSGFASLSKAGWSAPFQWWWQSFTGQWEGEQS